MSFLKTQYNNFRFLLISPFVDLDDAAINMDIERWKSIMHISGDNKQVLKKLLSNVVEFRNLYIYRNKHRLGYNRVLRMLYHPLDTLWITTEKIGGGLFIQHGFSTYIAAESIGENCWINQMVNIGYKDDGRPARLGNNVTVACGAVVVGDITVGDNSIIGANAVVTKDVAPGSVMGGVPARKLN